MLVTIADVSVGRLVLNIDMSKHFKRWGAAYILAALFIGSWLGQYFSQLVELKNEAASHGQTFSMSEFWPAFWQATFENWQSEWLQLFVQAAMLLALKHQIFKAEAEDLERLEAKVDSLLEKQKLDPAKIRDEYESKVK